ncbi:NAD(P)H-hydrate dehydratase, partial [Enterobacter sichuanensis]|nr:NAD(P)H-hydrate dehydratase [Enterobacter sichuanensis]
GTYGRVLVVAGTYNMCGAAFLSAKAAYKTGAGLVRIFTEESNRTMLQTMLPEAILTTYDTCDYRHEQLEEAAEWADVIVFGPGIGKKAEKRRMLELLIKVQDKPLLIDADGLNLLAENPQPLG